MAKMIHVIGGGTVYHIRPHLVIGAKAKGTVAKKIATIARTTWPWPEYRVAEHLTFMADPLSKIETNEDVSNLVDKLIGDSETKVIFMTAALVDYRASVVENGITTPSGKSQPRLKSSRGKEYLELIADEKVISKIRKTRKDIFLIACKTTTGASEDEMFESGLSLLKKNSCNLVLVNDLHTRMNMIVVPELSRYSVTSDRERVVKDLVEMTKMRAGLTFSRTQVDPGELVPWSGDRVPDALRTVVNHCIARGAYQAFNNITVGHFGLRTGEQSFLSSRRKMNFNKEADRDLVETHLVDGQIVAKGAKPSAGARSQYMVLTAYPEYDCIVHFHCPTKPDASISLRTQKPYECGSHECGKNTADGLVRYDQLAAVMLDQHGPNIVFSSKVDPQTVIDFIETNFDVSRTTR